MDENELLDLEQSCWEDSLEYIPPCVVLDLVDEIKRLRGWKILERPEDFQGDPPLKPVHFDFRELD